METKYEKQRKAISRAIRDAHRELVKAKQNGDEEWIKDCVYVIEGLEGARSTLESVQTLVDLVKP